MSTFPAACRGGDDQICCETCADRNPQPEGWNRSEEWAVKQEALYKKFGAHKMRMPNRTRPVLDLVLKIQPPERKVFRFTLDPSTEIESAAFSRSCS